jgi:hypothetical protein
MKAGLNPTNNAPPGANDGIKTGRAILLHAAIFLNLCGKAVIGAFERFWECQPEDTALKSLPESIFGSNKFDPTKFRDLRDGNF